MTFNLVLGALLLATPPEMDRDRWFAEDKVRHFVASFVATSFAASGIRFLGLEPREAIAIGAGVGFATGIAKEIHDVRSGGFFSYRDLVWDLGGVGASVVLLDAAR